MAEFQEQDLFQGAVQTQGFSPLQAPDTSQFLRENMEQVDRNFANLKSQRQAQLDSTLAEQLRTLEMFGQFSKTALETAKVMGQAYIDHQFVEGANKMRSQMGYGVTDEQRLEYEATKAVLKSEEQNNVDLLSMILLRTTSRLKLLTLSSRCLTTSALLLQSTI